MTARKTTLAIAAVSLTVAAVVAGVRDGGAALPERETSPEGEGEAEGAAAAASEGPESSPDGGTEGAVDELGPVADYHSLEGARIEGAHAVGRTVLIRAWRGTTSPGAFSAYPCRAGGDAGWARLHFAPEQRELVRAIPTTVLGDCPQLYFRITENEPTAAQMEGHLLSVWGVEPLLPPTDLPEGVDFVSMDELNLAGAAAEGKVGLVPFYRGSTTPDRFTAHPCDEHGGIELLFMRYEDAQRQTVSNIPTSPSSDCRTLRFRVLGRDPASGAWRAELIAME